jgi:crotonobetaine/carnitine-CoA ligase
MPDGRESKMASQRDLTGVANPADVVSREICVLRYALERHAVERGNAIYALFQGGKEWSFCETLRQVRACAAGLYAHGVRQGDRVIVMMPNGLLGLQALFAANYLGAIFVPVNPALKGSLLEHVFVDSAARFAVVEEGLLGQITALNAPVLTTIFSSGDVPVEIDLHGRTVLPAKYLYGNPDNIPEPEDFIEPWHTQSIIYTSGTTGRSKGVLSSYMHSYSAMSPETWTCTRAGDRHLLHMPIFHIGGSFVASSCLCSGSSIAVVSAFKTDTFWQAVREMEVTVVFLLGAMATFLLKSPPKPDDRDHPLRMVFIVPLGQSGPAFQERFGVDVYTLFNMTEISTPLLSDVNPVKPNTCGRPRPGVEVRLVDGNDCEVPSGAVGQLVIRTAAPWAMNHGYDNNPQATIDAWRNGWFHTGDAFIRDEDGDFFFVDRLKDTIRRRGENISSYEIEIELLAHADVREAAAVPVPSEFTEDEVLIVVAPVEGRSIEPARIIDFLRARVPNYMVPRYIRVVDELPKTPTAKVQKHVLREQGVTADTWDREVAEFYVRKASL